MDAAEGVVLRHPSVGGETAQLHLWIGSNHPDGIAQFEKLALQELHGIQHHYTFRSIQRFDVATNHLPHSRMGQVLEIGKSFSIGKHKTSKPFSVNTPVRTQDLPAKSLADRSRRRRTMSHQLVNDLIGIDVPQRSQPDQHLPHGALPGGDSPGQPEDAGTRLRTLCNHCQSA